MNHFKKCRDLSEAYASLVADQGKTLVPEDVCEAFVSGWEAAIKLVTEYHKGQPDHDAELLGYKDGEAPTVSSKAWAFANKAR